MMAWTPTMCRLAPSADGASRRLGVVAADSPATVQGRSRTNGVIVVVGARLNQLLEQRLEKAGFDVAYHRSIDSARPLLNDTVPAAILLGSTREANALGEIRALRGHERLAFVQIVVVRGEGDVTAGAAIDAGADDIFDAADDSASGIEEQGTRILARIGRAERLSALALLDPLTGLQNRRFMNERLPAEIARAGRARGRLSIGVIDLDEFKEVNDRFGHAAGDRALVAFARALRSELRSYDIVCRFGGDEFVVLFPDCGARGGHAALHQLQRRRSWAVQGLPVVSFSAGLAQFPDDGRSWKELFDAADENVRRAKASGRGRTIGPTAMAMGNEDGDAQANLSRYERGSPPPQDLRTFT
jgi:diguanylate cyclase (GGDEF)-like protein